MFNDWALSPQSDPLSLAQFVICSPTQIECAFWGRPPIPAAPSRYIQISKGPDRPSPEGCDSIWSGGPQVM